MVDLQRPPCSMEATMNTVSRSYVHSRWLSTHRLHSGRSLPRKRRRDSCFSSCYTHCVKLGRQPTALDPTASARLAPTVLAWYAHHDGRRTPSWCKRKMGGLRHKKGHGCAGCRGRNMHDCGGARGLPGLRRGKFVRMAQAGKPLDDTRGERSSEG